MCQQEAAGSSLTGYTFVGNNDNENDDFSRKGAKGPDAFCGFGGDARTGTLAAGDILLGDAGSDSVSTANLSTFYGGAGNDSRTRPPARRRQRGRRFRLAAMAVAFTIFYAIVSAVTLP